jgi:branched-chain amino acid transport system substrate-binding protein
MDNRKKAGSSLILCAFLMLLIAMPGWAQDTVTIVMIDPLSGPMKTIGDYNVMGAQFAVDEINAAGGLLGKKVKLLPEDSQLKPDVAARKATKAIMTDGAKFIFQLTSTAVAQALMDVAEKNKIIYVNFGAESDFLWEELHKYSSAPVSPPPTAPGPMRNSLRQSRGGSFIS